ncbi:MAG: helix-turn-helix domain-containing protein [Clostridia bacterium]|nr:helix-turn-helix domain-containing protein [Clostridia bacterium]
MMIDITIDRIVNMFYRNPPGWSRPVHSIRHYDALVWFADGSNEYSFENKTIVASKGDMLLLPGNVPYSGIGLSDGMCYYVVDFLCTKPDACTEIGAPILFTPHDSEYIDNAFRSALSEWNRKRIEIELYMKAFVYSMLHTAYRDNSIQKNAMKTEDILKYIENSIENCNLTVTSLCNRFFISESQIRRNILRATGLTPVEYIKDLRLNRAKTLLINTKRSVKDISASCGFTSPYYFSRCFHEAFGMSPSDYRDCFYTM